MFVCLFVSVLWHTNLCRLFNAKFIFIQNMIKLRWPGYNTELHEDVRLDFGTLKVVDNRAVAILLRSTLNRTFMAPFMGRSDMLEISQLILYLHRPMWLFIFTSLAKASGAAELYLTHYQNIAKLLTQPSRMLNKRLRHSLHVFMHIISIGLAVIIRVQSYTFNCWKLDCCFIKVRWQFCTSISKAR